MDLAGIHTLEQFGYRFAQQRVTQIRRYPMSGGNEDTCQRVDLSYDTNPYESSYTQNGWGRLTAGRGRCSATRSTQWGVRSS